MAGLRLNKEQHEAVEHDLGPLLVLAGAGSGKTGVVTQRIARLIRKGVPARAMLAMTFTNKAASEMQERVVRLVGAKRSKGLLLCTFHRFGLKVLSREARALGLRGGRFAIFDRADCMGVLRDALRNTVTMRNLDLGAVLNRISLAKNAFIDAETYASMMMDSDDEYDEITSIAYPRYAAALRSLQAFDFDDLVCEPVRLWRLREEVLERWRMRFRYIIVDEYQDTNVAQLEMLRLLASEHKNLCVVGDDDQAIYAWRGADVRNILDFEKHFSGAKLVRLERNYRSTEAVLEVANSVLEASKARRHKKRLIPTQGPGDKVKLVRALDGTTEARFVVDEAKRIIDRGDGRAKDIAVLYRSNLQAPEIESELKARGLPYQLFGGTQTFERKEVKDLIAYIEVAINPWSELAVRRSLNYPARGIGEVALNKLAVHATLHDSSLYAAVERAHAVAGLSDRAREGCRTYVRTITDIVNGIADDTSASDVIRALAEAVELKQNIWAESGQNNKLAGRRWNNVLFLIKAFGRRDAKERMDRDGYAKFLRVLMLREQQDEDSDVTDKITLTTMHGAKGLEFGFVFVVGLEEGLMPHRRSIEERVTDTPQLDGRATDEIEQERRLFYVAITRAKKQLYLCHASGRATRRKIAKRVPSRFVLEIPEELVENVDIMTAPQPDVAAVKRGADDVLAAILGSGNKSA
jgi:superfamily I DNA/RNA helicase